MGALGYGGDSGGDEAGVALGGRGERGALLRGRGSGGAAARRGARRARHGPRGPHGLLRRAGPATPRLDALAARADRHARCAAAPPPGRCPPTRRCSPGSTPSSTAPTASRSTASSTTSTRSIPTTRPSPRPWRPRLRDERLRGEPRLPLAALRDRPGLRHLRGDGCPGARGAPRALVPSTLAIPSGRSCCSST